MHISAWWFIWAFLFFVVFGAAMDMRILIFGVRVIAGAVEWLVSSPRKWMTGLGLGFIVGATTHADA